MNYKAVARYLALVMKAEALFMIVPAGIALFYGEFLPVRGFVITGVVLALAGLPLDFAKRGTKAVHSRDSFVVVAVCWTFLAVSGALPYWIGREIPSFFDCVFESVSGFTTTGASVIADVESMPRSMQFWHSFSQWVGGMGVLVLLLAVSAGISRERGVLVMRAEASGPDPGKLVPKLWQSSFILYGIYFGLTVLQVPLLLAGGMPLFDSVITAMSTAGTGGFSVRNASIAAYGSAYLETVVAVFMFLFGIGFNLFYMLLVRNLTELRKNDEARWYLGINAVAALLIAFNLTGTVCRGFGQALGQAAFQVGAFASSTGFCSAEYTLWPQFSRMLLFLLMFVGACSGSTGCGIKVSRFLIMLREVRRLIHHALSPRSVEVVKLNGRRVAPETVYRVGTFCVLYGMIFAASWVLVSMDNRDFETTVSAVAACLNNVGQGFGEVAQTGGYAGFSLLSKAVLALDMLLGRLEIFPILLMFSPGTWRKV